MNSCEYEYDVLVIGAGHAGTEAALAAARMGAHAALLTANLDTVGQMSCNPAIGGIAKGQIVREIDALGGAMGQAIDATGIQFRLLNRRKGPAMHSPRAQADKKAYQQEIKRIVEDQANLDLRQEIVEDILTEQFGEQTRVSGVRVRGDVTYKAPTVILTTGTFLQAIMHTGEAQAPGGRAGEGAAVGLSRSLAELGIELARFKTGTPCRLNGRTIDFSQCEPQPGDDVPQPFSFSTERIDQPQNLVDVPADRDRVVDDRANLAFGVDHEQRAHGDGLRLAGVDHSVLVRDLPTVVGDQRVVDLHAQLVVDVLAPGQVSVNAVNRQADQLDVTSRELVGSPGQSKSSRSTPSSYSSAWASKNAASSLAIALARLGVSNSATRR